MLRLLCGSATSIYPSLFRSLSASRIPTITTTSATPIPVHLPPRLRPFSHSLRYAKGNRTATLPSQKRLSTQSHTHKKAQKDRGASKKKKADLRAVLCARREASQQVRREREEKVGEKKGEKPALGAAEKKRVKKELLKEKKAKKMEEKRLAKEVKEVERFAKRVRRKSKSPGKGDGTRRKDGGAGSRTRSNNDRLKDDRAGGRGGEARVSSPVSIGGRKRARSREVSRIRGRGEKRRVEDEDGYVRRRKHGSDFGSPVPRGEPPFQNISWKRGQKNKAGGWNTQNIVSDDEIFFAGNVQWKSPEEDELRREKAPPGKREREKMRLRHSRERSASMTRRAWTSSLEMAASPDRKVDLKERLRAVRLPPELIQREPLGVERGDLEGGASLSVEEFIRLRRVPTVSEAGEKDGRDGMTTGEATGVTIWEAIEEGEKIIEEGDKVVERTADKSKKSAKVKTRKEEDIHTHPPAFQVVIDTAHRPLPRPTSHTRIPSSKSLYQRHTTTSQNPTRINTSAKRATIKEK
ncbi:hypothetical protein EV426DRAFT_706273 [Tirmania nivea]|nr:hypothetical protein EV426DRAFT_706273 [Tirmania nivea]